MRVRRSAAPLVPMSTALRQRHFRREATRAPRSLLRTRTMAASSWATYEASKALLAEHGSVAGVKAAAAAKPAFVAPLTAGLDKWSAIDAAVALAAKDVDIVIPVRARAGRDRRGERAMWRARLLRRADAPLRCGRRRSATWTSWSSGVTSCCRTT